MLDFISPVKVAINTAGFREAKKDLHPVKFTQTKFPNFVEMKSSKDLLRMRWHSSGTFEI